MKGVQIRNEKSGLMAKEGVKVEGEEYFEGEVWGERCWYEVEGGLQL